MKFIVTIPIKGCVVVEIDADNEREVIEQIDSVGWDYSDVEELYNDQSKDVTIVEVI